MNMYYHCECSYLKWGELGSATYNKVQITGCYSYGDDISLNILYNMGTTLTLLYRRYVAPTSPKMKDFMSSIFRPLKMT